MDRLGLDSGYKVLDVGCGSGRHMAAMSDIVEDVMVVGSDLCFKDLRLARTRMKFHDQYIKCRMQHWELVCSDMMALPFADNSFDLIVCSEVLEHLYDDRQGIKEMVRVLKPNKNFVISVPRYLPEKIFWTLSNNYIKGNDSHVRIYRKNELISLLEYYGLICYNTHCSHSLHTPFWLLKCLFGTKAIDSLPVKLYHDFLVWDIMKKPYITRLLDRLLNPILGKSLVLYTTKIL